MQEKEIYVLLGGNAGEATLCAFANVIHFIRSAFNEAVVTSSMYTSSSWGFSSEHPFFNQVLRFRCSAKPEVLLERLLEEEERNGRQRLGVASGYSDRVIDVDILYIGDEIISTERLEVPHPRLHLRRFTLLPLQEVAPDFLHPKLRKTHSELLVLCNDPSNVQKTPGEEMENNNK